MIVEVSGHRGLENGLVVPGKFTASTKSSSASTKIKGRLLEEIRQFVLEKYSSWSFIS